MAVSGAGGGGRRPPPTDGNGKKKFEKSEAKPSRASSSDEDVQTKGTQAPQEASKGKGKSKVVTSMQAQTRPPPPSSPPPPPPKAPPVPPRTSSLAPPLPASSPPSRNPSTPSSSRSSTPPPPPLPRKDYPQAEAAPLDDEESSSPAPLTPAQLVAGKSLHYCNKALQLTESRHRAITKGMGELQRAITTRTNHQHAMKNELESLNPKNEKGKEKKKQIHNKIAELNSQIDNIQIQNQREEGELRNLQILRLKDEAMIAALKERIDRG